MNCHQVLVGTAIAVLAVGLSAGIGCKGRGGSGTAAPSYIAPQQFEAGQLIVNLPHDVTHRFEFRNERAERIEITSIKPSCGCTDVQAPDRVLEPGESSWLDMTVTLRGSGAFATDVAVHWSTGEVTLYTLEAFATVARELSLPMASVDVDIADPRSFLLTYVDQEGAAPGAVQVESGDEVVVTVGAWTEVIAANRDLGVSARYAAPVQIELISSIDSVARVRFGLVDEPALPRAELVVRTPALVQAYAANQSQRRPSTGPIVIDHSLDAEGTADQP